jgi:hypothetical protein
MPSAQKSRQPFRPHNYSLPTAGPREGASDFKEFAMLIYFPLLVAVIGVLMYALCANPKLAEVGRIMFWTGLLAFLLGGRYLLTVVK